MSVKRVDSPEWGSLSRLASNAQETTDETWARLIRAPVVPRVTSPQYRAARINHGRLPLYSQRAVKLG